MPQKTPYWEKIASQIETRFKKGNPEHWTQEQIIVFLIQLEKTVKKHCLNDSSKADHCGVPFIKKEYLIEQWRTIDASTFRRIFQYGNSTGKTQTKQQFAIFLGYESYENFLNREDVNQKGTTEEEGIIFPTSKNSFEIQALNIGLRWIILWLVISTLLHNIFGIIKGNLGYPNWIYLFWVPPILIGVAAYAAAWQFIKKSKDNKLLPLMLIWWVAVLSMILINQYIPGWYHFIETASLLIIGIVGQLSLATKQGIALFYSKSTFALVTSPHSVRTTTK